MSQQHNAPSSQVYHLPQDGEPPFVLQGTVLVTSLGQWCEDIAQQRWHDITVYRMHDDQVVVHWEYHTEQPGEVSHAAVEVVETLAEAVMVLQCWGVTLEAILLQEGAVPHDTTAILADVLTRYDQQVDVLIEGLGAPDIGPWAWG